MMRLPVHHNSKRIGLLGMAVAISLATEPGWSQQWQSVPSSHLPISSAPPVWEAVSSSHLPISPLAWEPVPLDEVIDPNELAQAEASIQSASAPTAGESTKTPWVTGGLYQVKRGDVWLPSITQRVPNGYGNRFGGFQAGIFLESCNVTGGYVCGTNSISDEFKNYGKGTADFVVGLGDPVKLIGIDLGFNFTSLATTRPGQESEGTKFGEGQGLNLAISRNLGRDVSLKVGAINLVELDETQKDTGKSAYAVISARFDLGGPIELNTNDLYITAGIANGLYRPLGTIVEDQAQACNSLRSSTGNNQLTPQQTRNCNADGLNYGSPSPVASVSWMINPQVSLIAEWWGRNLSLAASFKPFEDINWVITPGITNIIKNVDWDPSVPGYTDRYRLQLTTSIGF
jgi:hypothetical protein